MIRWFRIFAAWSICLSLTAVALPSETLEQNVDSASANAEQNQQRVLVLRDGGVLVGRVTQNGDRYLVARSGNEMQIPAASVMLVANSIEAAYNARRDQLAEPSADAHLALADWCLRCKLFEQAKRELADARQLEPRHPRIALLERRLSIAEQQQQEKLIAQPKANAPASAAIEHDQTNASISELPAGAVELFTRRVQPILVNNCTASGCHQRGGEEQFQLDRAILRGMANRRSTMNNLNAVLELVDRRQPQLSQLLTVPRQTHGDMEEPIFGPRHVQAFSHLVEWVALVTAETTVQTNDTPPISTENEDLVGNGDDMPPNLSSPILRVPARSDAASAEGDVAQARFDESLTSAVAGPIGAKFRPHGPQLRRWQPRDPFDPEIFNRSYRNVGSAPLEAGGGEAAEMPAE